MVNTCILRVLIIAIVTITALTLSATIFAEPSSDTENIYNVMRDIGIKYIISNDRKLPKSDRNAWQLSLANYVDFDSVNEGMRINVREAIGKLSNVKIDYKTSTALEEKAVLFLVPKKLSNFMRLYLVKMDEISLHPKCSSSKKPADNNIFILCEDKISTTEVVIRFLHTSKAKNSLVFIKSDRWRLSRIDTDITEEQLNLLARWK